MKVLSSCAVLAVAGLGLAFQAQASFAFEFHTANNDVTATGRMDWAAADASDLSGSVTLTTVSGDNQAFLGTYEFSGAATVVSGNFWTRNAEVTFVNGTKSVTMTVADNLSFPYILKLSENGQDVASFAGFDTIVIPEPTTVLAGALLGVPFGLTLLRVYRKKA